MSAIFYLSPQGGSDGVGYGQERPQVALVTKGVFCLNSFFGSNLNDPPEFTRKS